MTAPVPPPSLLLLPRRRGVNLRSVALGLLGVIFICGLSPYNDMAVNNTSFTGNFLPIGLVLFFLVLVLLINAPLRAIWPRMALDGQELAVALGMTLVSCALPGSGLMRFLPSQLVGFWYHAGQNPDYRDLLTTLDLPDWIFPAYRSHAVLDRANDPIVQQYWTRAPSSRDTFLSHLRAVPWAAWARPAAVWFGFFFCVWTAVICLTTILRRQWVENERLPFPLAGVYVSLIEQPAEGKVLNPLFSSRGFWIAFLGVFAVHAVNSLHVYYPRPWPEIPLKFNFNAMITNPPFSHIDWFVKGGAFYFTIIGITFFVQTRVAFSIWFCMMLWQVPRMIYGTRGVEFSFMSIRDHLFGGLVPYALTILWIGRKHWGLVLKQMTRGARAGEARGRYLPYAAAGWGLVLSLLAIAVFLFYAGATVLGIVILVGMFLLVITVIMRIVAETGLLFIHFLMPMWRPWTYVLDYFPTMASARSTLRSVFFGTFMESVIGNSQRESLAVYTSHALRVADVQVVEAGPRVGPPLQQDGRPRGAAPTAFIACLFLALIVGYGVSGVSHLYVEYTYASTLDASQRTPLNDYAMTSGIQQTLGPVQETRAAGQPSRETHNRTKHVLIGAGITSVLSFLHLRYTAWPIHPLGFLLLQSWTIWLTWPSIFAGWCAKVLVLRIGGPSAFRSARTFFIGLILGEAGAAAFWLAVSLVRVSLGMDYKAINLLPM